jgi:hypothetical protein
LEAASFGGLFSFLAEALQPAFCDLLNPASPGGDGIFDGGSFASL